MLVLAIHPPEKLILGLFISEVLALKVLLSGVLILKVLMLSLPKELISRAIKSELLVLGVTKVHVREVLVPSST